MEIYYLFVLNMLDFWDNEFRWSVGITNEIRSPMVSLGSTLKKAIAGGVAFKFDSS